MSNFLEKEIDFSKIPTRSWTDGRTLDISNDLGSYPTFPRRIRTALMKEPINLKPPFRLLDIGCGTGTAVYYMRNHEIEAYGIDIDPAPVMPYDNEIFFKEDATQTHFPNNFFDAVMESWMVAQIRLEEREEVIPDIILEINRIVKEKGIIISHPLGGFSSADPFKDYGFKQVEFPRSYWGSSSYPWLQAFQLERKIV